jgi:hypothetical protein
LFLVVLGTVVAAFAGRLRIPAPSLLVIAGPAVALLPRFPPVHVPPDVVSLVVLPPLLYAASEELPWRDLQAAGGRSGGRLGGGLGCGGRGCGVGCGGDPGEPGLRARGGAG